MKNCTGLPSPLHSRYKNPQAFTRPRIKAFIGPRITPQIISRLPETYSLPDKMKSLIAMSRRGNLIMVLAG